MSFTRTKSGINNSNLFFDSEIIVYTEGGAKSYSFEDVQSGKFNKYSVDIKFWSNIFNKYQFSKKVKFKALGSKTSANKICEMIVNGDVSNTCVTRDSDLDDFTGQKFDSPYILYTRGYSWENDVYQAELVKDQAKSLVMGSEIPLEFLACIDDAYKNVSHLSKRLLKLELIFRSSGIKLITSCNGERFISKKSAPTLRLDQVKSLIKEKKEGLNRPVKIEADLDDICTTSFTYGKLLEDLALSLITYIYKKQTKKNTLQKDIIIFSMIERFCNRIDTDQDLYYKALIENLEAA